MYIIMSNWCWFTKFAKIYSHHNFGLYGIQFTNLHSWSWLVNFWLLLRQQITFNILISAYDKAFHVVQNRDDMYYYRNNTIYSLYSGRVNRAETLIKSMHSTYTISKGVLCTHKYCQEKHCTVQLIKVSNSMVRYTLNQLLLFTAGSRSGSWKLAESGWLSSDWFFLFNETE